MGLQKEGVALTLTMEGLKERKMFHASFQMEEGLRRAAMKGLGKSVKWKELSLETQDLVLCCASNYYVQIGKLDREES